MQMATRLLRRADEVVVLGQRPTFTFLVFGVGQPHMKRLENVPRRPPTEAEVRAFARTMGHSVVTQEPLWVLEVEVTAEEAEQVYEGDRAVLCYCEERRALE
jgi:hypothetical protein